MRLGNHTVEVTEPPARDAHGDPLPGTGSTFAVEGCNLQQYDTVEVVQGRNTVTTRTTVAMPPGTPITSTCTVAFRGVVYAVEGRPNHADDLNGTPHHIEVGLTEVRG